MTTKRKAKSKSKTRKQPSLKQTQKKIASFVLEKLKQNSPSKVRFERGGVTVLIVPMRRDNTPADPIRYWAGSMTALIAEMAIKETAEKKVTE